MTLDDKAWDIWVDYCRKVKAWYAEGQKEPWGMNPPTEQIADATIAQDAAYREMEGKLCAAREAMSKFARESTTERGTSTGSTALLDAAEMALSSSSPCRHAAIAERVEDTEQIRALMILAWEKRSSFMDATRAVQVFLKGEG